MLHWGWDVTELFVSSVLECSSFTIGACSHCPHQFRRTYVRPCCIEAELWQKIPPQAFSVASPSRPNLSSIFKIFDKTACFLSRIKTVPTVFMHSCDADRFFIILIYCFICILVSLLKLKSPVLMFWWNEGLFDIVVSPFSLLLNQHFEFPSCPC